MVGFFCSPALPILQIYTHPFYQACLHPEPVVIPRCWVYRHLRGIPNVADVWLVHARFRAGSTSTRRHGDSCAGRHPSTRVQLAVGQHGLSVIKGNDGRLRHVDSLVSVVFRWLPHIFAMVAPRKP